MKEQGIRFYITEHIADLNEQMRKLGIGYLIEEGCVRRTIYIALKDMGIKRPYPLEGGVDNEERSASRKRVDNRMQEFVWAFGSDTEDQIERQLFAGLGVTVTVIEKFRLSGQYTPQNFLETYRSSMELELRNYNMLEYNMFKQAQITFPGENDLRMILPDSVIAREKSCLLYTSDAADE